MDTKLKSSPGSILLSPFLIPLVIALGFIVLFFFPEPETNFLYYIGTALFFIALVATLIFLQRRTRRHGKS